MAVIDIGAGATDRATYLYNPDCTHVDKNNPANADGSLTMFEVWFDTASAQNATNVKMGTLYATDSTYNTSRDSETLGTVTKGSKQTFTGLDCTVVTGDFIGIYYKAVSYIEMVASGGAGVFYTAGDVFGAGSKTYSTYDADAICSIYGEGATVGVFVPFKSFYPNILAH